MAIHDRYPADHRAPPSSMASCTPSMARGHGRDRRYDRSRALAVDGAAAGRQQPDLGRRAAAGRHRDGRPRRRSTPGLAPRRGAPRSHRRAGLSALRRTPMVARSWRAKAAGSSRWTRRTRRSSWRFDTGDAQTGTAGVIDGIAYIGGSGDGGGGLLWALDATTGEELWRIDEPIFTPAVADGVGYSGSVSGLITAFDTATGAIRWQETVEGTARPLAVADGVVYIPADAEQRVYALDAQTGDELWRFELDAGIDCCIAVAHGSVFVGTRSGASTRSAAMAASLPGRRRPLRPAAGAPRCSGRPRRRGPRLMPKDRPLEDEASAALEWSPTAARIRCATRAGSRSRRTAASGSSTPATAGSASSNRTGPWSSTGAPKGRVPASSCCIARTEMAIRTWPSLRTARSTSSMRADGRSSTGPPTASSSGSGAASGPSPAPSSLQRGSLPTVAGTSTWLTASGMSLRSSTPRATSFARSKPTSDRRPPGRSPSTETATSGWAHAARTPPCASSIRSGRLLMSYDLRGRVSLVFDASGRIYTSQFPEPGAKDLVAVFDQGRHPAHPIRGRAGVVGWAWDFLGVWRSMAPATSTSATTAPRRARPAR